MTWVKDLTPCRDNTTALAVGWLSPEHPFSTGTVSQEVRDRIAFLVEHAPTELTRGHQRCLFCTSSSPAVGNGEIRVVGGDGRRYAAPVMIGHYIESHGYCPPIDFQEALFASPQIDPEHPADRCLSCGGDLLKHAEYDDLVRASDRRPVIVTYYYCAACDVKYERVRLR